MSGTPVVSVIIPVYNAGKYLRPLLDSILAQTLADFEALAVDDGSKDDSWSILQAYAAQDARIRPIRQENAGAGPARNNGIDHARGEFLFFADADDMLLPTLLEKTVARARKTGADTVLFNCISRSERTGEEAETACIRRAYLPRGKQVFSRRDVPERILQVCLVTPWCKLYRREFILREGLRFQTLPSCNDRFFVEMSYILSRKITCVREPLYVYRYGHINTTSRKYKFPQCSVQASMAVYEELKRRGLLASCRVTWANRAVDSAAYALRQPGMTRDTRLAILRSFAEPEVAESGMLSLPQNKYISGGGYELIRNGVDYALPFARELDEGLSGAAEQSVCPGFRKVYELLLAYLAELDKMDEPDPTDPVNHVRQASNFITQAYTAFGEVSRRERYAVLALPDRTYSLMRNLIQKRQ